MEEQTLLREDSNAKNTALLETRTDLSTEPAGRTRWQIDAYYNNRRQPRSMMKPKPSEVHWNKRPNLATAMYPVESTMSFQVLPCLGNPQPSEGSQKRWPAVGIAGAPSHPLDDRKHDHWFGYREQRWRRHWVGDPVIEQPPELTLDYIRIFLTQRFGSLKAAFHHLDFFQDGLLSRTEWSEGLYNLFSSSGGADGATNRNICQPRWLFNERMTRLFYTIDENNDGLIAFDEFSAPHLLPSETPHESTLRRTAERAAAGDTADSRSGVTMQDIAAKGKATTMSDTPAAERQRLLEEFSRLIMAKFSRLDEAFKEFDVNGTGQLSRSEFQNAARSLKFKGDAMAVFNELDLDGIGTICPKEFKRLRQLPEEKAPTGPCTQRESVGTRKDLVQARRRRSPIRDPSHFKRGLTLSSTDINRPLSENTHTSAGFHTFARVATDRLDLKLHPEQLPGTGVEPEAFSPEHGPGAWEKGPGYHSETGCKEHPLRGNGWKSGSTWGRTERFGPAIPSKQKRLDRELSATYSHNHQNQWTKDTWTVNNLGAHSMGNKVARHGPTHGNTDSFGLLAPKPIGPWLHTRASLCIKSKSTSSLLGDVC